MELKRIFGQLIRQEDGMNMVEYALIGAFVSIASVGVLKLLGPQISALFESINTSMGG